MPPTEKMFQSNDVQYRGGVQYREAVQYRGVFNTMEDIMMHVGAILRTVGDVQYRGGKS